MSKLTVALLSSIDYERVKDNRRRNYIFFEKNLAEKNLLHLQFSDEVPMVYPFRTKNETLRTKLIKNKIYVATCWPNVLSWCNEHKLEYSLAKQIMPLPIDQRYDETELLTIINMLK